MARPPAMGRRNRSALPPPGSAGKNRHGLPPRCCPRALAASPPSCSTRAARLPRGPAPPGCVHCRFHARGN
eukprot:7936071-Lingulodinium_polyedra.AAC.1